MPDRLALPNDRRDACRACGSMKREYLTTCAVCGTDICSSCLMTYGEQELCDLCIRYAQAEQPEPECTCRLSGDQADASDCDVHGWHVPYGHQLCFGEVA